MNGPARDNKELCRVGIRNFAISTMLYKWCVIRFTVKYKSELGNPESAAYIYHFSPFGWSCRGGLLIHARNSGLMIFFSPHCSNHCEYKLYFFFLVVFPLRYSLVNWTRLTLLNTALWCTCDWQSGINSAATLRVPA